MATKLDILNELKKSYLEKFDEPYPLWSQSLDEAINSIKNCIKENEPYKISIPKEIRT